LQRFRALGARAQSVMPALIDALLAQVGPCPEIGSAIGVIGPVPRDLPGLRAALRSSNPHVRFWAARAIVELGPAGELAIPELLERLCDSEHPTVDSVMWALGSIDEPAIAALCEAAAGGRIELRRRALVALGRYPDHVSSRLPPILLAMNEPDASIRGAAACAVCSLLQNLHRRVDMSSEEAAAVPALRQGLDRIAADGEIDIDRLWVARLIGWFNNKPADA
jgi:HEAT repeat protein